MSRLIKANTEYIRDAALRFERLAYEMESVAAALGPVADALGARPAVDGLARREGLSVRAEAAFRKANGLVYSLHDICGKLRYAAARYEEYDKWRKAPDGVIVSDDGGNDSEDY